MCCRLGVLALLGSVSTGGAEPRKAQPMCLCWCCPSLTATSDLAVHIVCWNTGNSCSVPPDPARADLWSCLTKVPHQFGDEMSGDSKFSPVRGCRVRAWGGELYFGAGSPKGDGPSSTELSINYCQVSLFNP